MSTPSILHLRGLKQAATPIVCLTAYDAGFASMLDTCGVDVLLVGDSLGMVLQGLASTVPVSMQAMRYHTRCVARGNRSAWIMADLPFHSYTTPEQAIRHSGQLLQDGAHMVKLEGGARNLDTVAALTRWDVPICVHLGLLPQSIHKTGTYKRRATTSDTAALLMQEARQSVEAGADMLLLENIPNDLAQQVTAASPVPVIGIGAGPDCDGQVLVLHDVLGMSPRLPPFAKDFLATSGSINAAITAYVSAVKNRSFPASC